MGLWASSPESFPLLPLFHSVEELAVIFPLCVQELSY